MTRATRAVIDCTSLRHNLQRVRRIAPQSRVMAVVKADGYGHGLLRMAEALAEADGFAVACVAEALRLREAGIDQPILALQGFRDEDELRDAAAHGVQLALHQDHQLRLLETSRLRQPLQVWLKLDTGMHRLGFEPQRAGNLHQALSALTNVEAPPRLMTHLACADERDHAFTERQLSAFDAAVGGIAAEQSVANTAGILGWRASHRHWVRPGLMLYGGSPFAGNCGERHGLKPVMTLKAPLIAVKRCQKGDGIGYGGAWVCPETMLIGIAAIGYGDGYPRHVPSGTPVRIKDQRTPLVGRVSMDMIAIDLRGVEGVQVGDEVTLWGEGLPVEEIADQAGTLAYELLCAVGKRVQVEVTG